jgi:hypothetical protein
LNFHILDRKCPHRCFRTFSYVGPRASPPMLSLNAKQSQQKTTKHTCENTQLVLVDRNKSIHKSWNMNHPHEAQTTYRDASARHDVFVRHVGALQIFVTRLCLIVFIGHFCVWISSSQKLQK